MYEIRQENSPNFVFMSSLTKCVEQEGVIYRHKNLSILKPPSSDTIFNGIGRNAKNKKLICPL